jgi:cellulose synthase/poly-beta-1,6-N-acetylglucosamine synthase-like glycosyltransferase
MASAGEEFNLFRRVLYLWTVYRYSLFIINMFIYLFYSLKQMCSGSCYTNDYSKTNIKIIFSLHYLFTNSAYDALFAIVGFFPYLTDNRQPNAMSDALLNLRLTSHFGEV